LSRFINPVPEYRPNSQLFFFKAGTNTQLVTYKDEIESIPNSQPVLCDSAGNTPNVFYQGSAKLIVLDENDVQYIERDPVGGDTELGNFTLWETTVTYDLNDIVEGSNGKFYISLSNSNTANDPTTTPTEWVEIRFIGVWNTNVTYSIGDVVQTSDGNLWKALTATAGNDPSADDGTNWTSAIDGSKIPEVSSNTIKIELVLPQTVSGELTVGGRVNQIRDSGAFTMPLANSVSADTVLIVELPKIHATDTPTLTRTGSDLFEDDAGTDTVISWVGAAKLTLTSDGVSKWSL